MSRGVTQKKNSATHRYPPICTHNPVLVSLIPKWRCKYGWTTLCHIRDNATSKATAKKFAQKKYTSRSKAASFIFHPIAACANPDTVKTKKGGNIFFTHNGVRHGNDTSVRKWPHTSAIGEKSWCQNL